MSLLFTCITMFLLCFTAGRAQEPLYLDIVINELLFNPAKDGYNYLEGYNRSTKTLDLENLLIANRNSTGELSSIKSVAKQPTPVMPGTYFIMSSNEKWLRQHYTIPAGVIVCQVALPSFPDDEGTVVLLNTTDTIIDELRYSEKWHFPLISIPEGVSLERINYESPTQDKNNWTSASSSSGYGTPGFQNSHFLAPARKEGEVIKVTPRIFSPDNDGVDDLGVIEYHINERGWLANLAIYDISGRRVRYLLKNEVLGAAGSYNWDGQDDRSRPLPSGIYILLTEIFNLDGRTSKFKNLIIIKRGSG